MHPAAFQYVQRFADPRPCRIYEVGSRNVNGSIRELFPAARWLGVDLQPGPNVDMVADAAAWLPEHRMFDYAICTEVLEHTPKWQSILFGLVYALRPGGRLIVTCAGINRLPHSAEDDGPWLQPREWYSPILAYELYHELTSLNLIDAMAEGDQLDTYATGVKP